MSKIINLYYIFSRNAIGLLLLAALFLNTSFINDKEQANSKIRTIVIDPGHGGRDPGNLGTRRYKRTEKHIALDISLKLGAYITEFFPEIEVIFTRKTNEDFLELWERTQLANDNDADLFMSIHCDAFTSPDAHGAGVYVMGMSKLKANMDVAMKENSVIYLEDDYKQNYDGFDPNSPESYIVFSLMQNTNLAQSLQIAEEIEQQFSTKDNSKSRGVKQAPFYVISRANMPSILIETGFLTNPKEEDYLHSEKGQDDLASSIFRAFKAYKEIFEGVSLDKNGVDNNILTIENTSKVLNSKIQDINDRVVFKVQIGTYLKSILNDDLFKDISVEEQVLDGIFKYYVGSATDKLVIDNLKLKMEEQGFKEAFVVAFFKGSQISTKEALNLQSKKNTHE